MTKQELLSIVEGELKTLQGLGGRSTNIVGARTKPIGGLEGFDSFNGLEFTVAMEATLNVEFNNDENLCVEDLISGARLARTIEQIADRVFDLFPTLKS